MLSRRHAMKMTIGSLLAALPMGARAAAAVPSTVPVEPEIVEAVGEGYSTYWHDLAADLGDTVSDIMPGIRPLAFEVTRAGGTPAGLTVRGDGFNLYIAGADPTGERFISLYAHDGLNELNFRQAIFQMLAAEFFHYYHR